MRLALSGAVFVFARTGATWREQAYLKASNADPGDIFGQQVAISSDGSTLVVGAIREDSIATGVGGNQTDSTGLDSGAASVFVRAGTTWAQQACVKASNTRGNDLFGYGVCASADGSTVGIGAMGEDSNGVGVGGSQTIPSASVSGAAYVFAR